MIFSWRYLPSGVSRMARHSSTSASPTRALRSCPDEKCLPAAANTTTPDLVVVVGQVEGGVELVDQLRVLGVGHVRAIEGDRAHRAVDGVPDRFEGGHGTSIAHDSRVKAERPICAEPADLGRIPSDELSRPLAPLGAAVMAARNRRSPRTALIGAVVALALVVTAAVPALGADGPDTPEPPSPIDLDLIVALETTGLAERWIDGSVVHAAVAFARATSPAYDPLRAELLDLADEHAALVVLRATTSEALRRDVALDAELTEAAQLLRLSDVRHRASLHDMSVELDDALARLDVVLSARQQLAIDAYVGDRRSSTIGLRMLVNDNEPLTTLELSQAASEELDHQQETEETVIEALEDGIDRENDVIAALAIEIETTITTILETRDRIDLAITTIELADERLARIVHELMPALVDQAVVAHATAIIEPLQFQVITLDGYVRGAEQTAELFPACGLQWPALAGIGRIETDHGRWPRGEIGADGVATRVIYGPLLDGTLENTVIIEDTDDGVLDGDDEYDRAVGPMQLIPSTWALVRSDGNGDGVRTVHDIYDAALAVGTYVCRFGGGDMSTEEGLRDGFFSYNQWNEYVRNVYDWMERYATYELADREEVEALRTAARTAR